MGVVTESVKRVLTELDWKTYMNAARKAHERGLNDRAWKFSNAGLQSFYDKYGTETFIPDEKYGENAGTYLQYGLGGGSHYNTGEYDEPHTYYGSEYQDSMMDYGSQPNSLHYNGTNYYRPYNPWYDDEEMGTDKRPSRFDSMLKPDELEKVKAGDADLSAYRSGKAKYSKDKGWTVDGQ